MRAARPGIELVVHDVTVGARARISSEIAESLGVLKRERADTDEQPEAHRKRDPEEAEPWSAQAPRGPCISVWHLRRPSFVGHGYSPPVGRVVGGVEGNVTF